MREVIPRQMLVRRLNSSTTAYIFWASVPNGSRMDSALSRTINISLEDRDDRRDARSSGFSMPAPITFESWRRKLAQEAGNLSQGMKRRLSPNRSFIRSWWIAVRAMEVFPIPPAPMRAMGLRVSARSTIFSINPSRPKQALGRGGGNSPRRTLLKCQIVDLSKVSEP